MKLGMKIKCVKLDCPIFQVYGLCKKKNNHQELMEYDLVAG